MYFVEGPKGSGHLFYREDGLVRKPIADGKNSVVTISLRYVHPSPEAVELVYDRLNCKNMYRVATVLAIVTSGQEYEVQ